MMQNENFPTPEAELQTRPSVFSRVGKLIMGLAITAGVLVLAVFALDVSGLGKFIAIEATQDERIQVGFAVPFSQPERLAPVIRQEHKRTVVGSSLMNQNTTTAKPLLPEQELERAEGRIVPIERGNLPFLELPPPPVNQAPTSKWGYQPVNGLTVDQLAQIHGVKPEEIRRQNGLPANANRPLTGRVYLPLN